MRPRSRAIGESCIVCGRGHLAVVLRELDRDQRKGLGRVQAGHVIEADIPIERLACDLCGVSFEAADRGRTVRGVRERGLKGFVNPDRFPDACPHCKCETFETGVKFAALASKDVEYHYCGCCLKPVWVRQAKAEKDTKRERRSEAPAARVHVCA